MNKIGLIIRREYLVRVRKPSFWLTTLLTPLLITAIYAVPALLFFVGSEQKTIEILDETNRFKEKFITDKDYKYLFVNTSLASAKERVNQEDSKVAALVFIPKDIVEKPDGLKLFAPKTVNFSLQNQIENTIQAEVRNERLRRANIDLKIIEDNRVNVNAQTYSLSDGKEKTSNTGVAMGLGYFISFLLYMTVFFSGSQVMNGVIEEKSSRIIEVMVSSVRPIELMLGKIFGIGLVGLTQFALWVILTAGITTGLSGFLKNKMEAKAKTEMGAMSQAETAAAIEKMQESSPTGKMMGVMDAVQSLPWAKLLSLMFFYYIGGYLLYSALFAAVGSASESPQEAQQLLFPVTIPLIISISTMSFVVSDPDSKVAFWTSIIPLTSPVNMMARLPFGVPWWELILSMVLLVLGFLGTTWVAARIYRVGILMYGKKVSFKELSKWLFYKA